MDALILAAGLGSRMEDLTKDTPKPLLTINNKALISYALDIVIKLPFDNIYVNTHYQSEQLTQYLKDQYPQILTSHENTILGTGGGIKKIQNSKVAIFYVITVLMVILKFLTYLCIGKTALLSNNSMALRQQQTILISELKIYICNIKTSSYI